MRAGQSIPSGARNPRYNVFLLRQPWGAARRISAPPSCMQSFTRPHALVAAQEALIPFTYSGKLHAVAGAIMYQRGQGIREARDWLAARMKQDDHDILVYLTTLAEQYDHLARTVDKDTSLAITK